MKYDDLIMLRLVPVALSAFAAACIAAFLGYIPVANALLVVFCVIPILSLALFSADMCREALA